MNIEVQNFLINTQGERIRLERQRLNLTQAQVAESVGVGKTTVINWEKEDGTSPNSIQMAKLLQMGFNILYILTGEVQENINNEKVEQNSDFVLIPYYQMEISAGLGVNSALGGTPKKYLAFRKDWLKTKGLNSDDLIAASPTGDSMGETIPNGCTMLIDTSKTTPRDGSIYVLRNGDTFWVKRVQIQLDGVLLLISDNPAYEKMPLDFKTNSNAQVIGQVIYVSKDIH
ncbi:S24 family peptidase [Alysiella crassa]|uniref:Uncharacterized HTH-type transcriptional regulator HI_1476 n=1 Tax=Alysiella crassa TaxID=153491 RepID=A0A376BT84_9NEIS|nr:helix-turn-helix transcriptional regulator [Alysiella crassa]UOP08036.1 helix-turn-helix transcriptional regulator [Alysiella crassa]SSY80109.1 Uncharacterized HTH-type transcriptional regulator HI_1476 [Alysiella crassa]